MRETYSSDAIREAILEAAKNSKYGKDPEHPEGDLTLFFTNVCNENVAAFLALFGELIQHEVDIQEPHESVEPTTDVGRRLQ